MKFHHLVISALSLAILSSCSVIGPKKSKQKNHHDSEMTAHRSTDKNSIDETVDYQSKIRGEWIIISVDGSAVPATDDMPYITFDRSGDQFYASNGCNIINGSYSVSSSGLVTFNNVLSTMKMCPETSFEGPISAAFSGSEPLSITIGHLGHDTIIRFLNREGVEIIKAKKHNMEFLNGNWAIISVGGRTVNTEDANLFIDIEQLKIHGNTGCNYFNGVIFINPEQTNAIDFSNLASTRMACPNSDQESTILLALEETTTAIEGSEGRVILLDSAGKELMTIKSIPFQSEE